MVTEFLAADEASVHSCPTLSVQPVASIADVHPPALEEGEIDEEEHILRIELAKVTMQLQRMIEISDERTRRSSECLEYAREGRTLAKKLLETYEDEDEVALLAWADRPL